MAKSLALGTFSINVILIVLCFLLAWFSLLSTKYTLNHNPALCQWCPLEANDNILVFFRASLFPLWEVLLPPINCPIFMLFIDIQSIEPALYSLFRRYMHTLYVKPTSLYFSLPALDHYSVTEGPSYLC